MNSRERMISAETAAGVREVCVRRARRGFGVGTLPFLRARANEIVTGPDYLLTRNGNEETIWECTFRRVMRVPNRHVRSWAMFVQSNELESNIDEAAVAVRVSQWHTDVDLRLETWKTSDQPSIESNLGVFSISVGTILEQLEELDRLLCAGVRLDSRRAKPEWVEYIFERTFASGVFRLAFGRDVGNEQFEQTVDSVSASIELLLADPRTAHSIDSMDIVYSGS